MISDNTGESLINDVLIADWIEKYCKDSKHSPECVMESIDEFRRRLPCKTQMQQFEHYIIQIMELKDCEC